MFERVEAYDQMLQAGIRLSGENKQFFIWGRLQELHSQLPEDLHPSRILDFGCGTGDTTKFLAEMFPQADIWGIDTSSEAIAYAQ